MTHHPTGSFTFVLHAHIPYARMHGRWPHGEEWVHEAATETYLPLLSALHDLSDEGVPYRITISLTPVLQEQLADPYMLANLNAYIIDLRDRASSDVARFARGAEAQRERVARTYVEHYGWLLKQFHDRFAGSIIGAFRTLQDRGFVDLATSAATHGYLPLFDTDSSVRAQVRQGVRTYRRNFGRDPQSFWLPECAYRASIAGDLGAARPPLEDFLAAEGVRLFFVDTHSIENGRASDGASPSAFRAYRVGTSDVAAIGRNHRAFRQVWWQYGYPGDFAYQEFHNKDEHSGLRYWRVTGDTVGLTEKAHYEPEAALARTKEHARHFVAVIEEELDAYRASSGAPGLMAAVYDAELFGHWWAEGVTWLADVLRRLAAHDSIALTDAATYVREHPPEASIEMPRGSWGIDGNDSTWLNPKTAWMWPVIHNAQRRVETIAAKHAGAVGAERDALNQLVRELMLLESSDWPYLVTTGEAAAYAERRFTQHAERFDALASMLESGDIASTYVDDLAQRDNLFANVEPRDYIAR
jgi:1,4-alpha-glucan branching enzyme